MSRLLSTTLQALRPYVPGEQPREPIRLKLNTNENPYGPSPKVLAAIQQATSDDLRLYPDPTAMKLRQSIAAYYELSPDQVFVGNGSDEVLGHLFQALFQRPGVVLLPDISYSFYDTYCALYGVKPHHIPLDDHLAIQADDYCHYNASPVAGIIFANPNAPTGLSLTLDDIARIARAHPDAAVVVDEAYVDFGADSAVALLGDYDNIVVVQTLSKSRALAGLRVGFALASPLIVEALTRVKDSFNSYPLDQLALVAAQAAMEDTVYFEEICRRIISDRNELSQQLAALGFTVLSSDTNFLFCRPPNGQAQALAQRLRQHGILVRHFNHARIQSYLRITVGTSQGCKTLCNALQQILSSELS